MTQPPMNPIPPPPSGGAPTKSSKGFATSSLVLGIIAAVFAVFCPPVGIILALIGLPLGAISFAQQQMGSAVSDSKGMAIAGVILNVVALVLWVVIFAGIAAGLDGLVNELSNL